jgi:hypothetical protein
MTLGELFECDIYEPARVKLPSCDASAYLWVTRRVNADSTFHAYLGTHYALVSHLTPAFTRRYVETLTRTPTHSFRAD